ncbi:Urease accessory protein UreF [Leptothrix cholodnii SP-6]|uniref:Urease accessory protein UreF n=1 Tax=Leptothrix cholodnii (strain ATCC 51168 / LMG 8142 / SP-6) TaxID=395495 RepID=B1Y3U5_LEPCP|nr:urease accessory UreF family protein [Leptothrix cholodnii]ACB33339.1 Urease accessory protein UreF [Leptothrix cholodnii SP-6]
MAAPSDAGLSASALLQLMWLASPALPVGGFSYSEGLESAVDAGLVTTEAQARTWLVDQLHLALARADLAVVAQAIPAWRGDSETGSVDIDRIEALNSWVRVTRESSEFRQQTEQMGRSLLEWLRTRDAAHVAAHADVAVDPRLAQLAALKPAPTWPVAHALALARTGSPLREALLAHGFGWAENMVQAALKTVPLGQSAGQRILAVLVEALPAAIDSALALGDEQRQAHTPMLAILSAQHEAQYSRLFRS